MLNRRSFFVGCACCAAGLSFSADAQTIALPAPTLAPVADGVWMHTTSTAINNAPFAANGLVIEGAHSVLLVDTGYNDRDANAVLELMRGAIPQRKPIICLGTHAHNDRIGGLEALKAAGAQTFVHQMTQADAPLRDLPLAQHVWTGRLRRFGIGGRGVEIFYPGPAHTRDNMVVWDEHTKTLFAGCMVRDMSWTSLGNVTDANIPAWPGSVEAVQSRYGARLARVVPGHGLMGGAELLAHTKALAVASQP